MLLLGGIDRKLPSIHPSPSLDDFLDGWSLASSHHSCGCRNKLMSEQHKE